MKRSGSRLSRASNNSNNVTESLIPGFSASRWKEFLEKEEKDLFILGIREDIVNNCMKICYENYLEKQAVAFTVHCAYLAWIKVIDVYYMHKDIGDTEDPIVKNSWEPDEEPDVSIVDSWGSQCIKPYSPEPEAVERKTERKISHFDEKSYPLPEGESLESLSFLSHVFKAEEEEIQFSYTPTIGDTKSIGTLAEKSAFSKILSISEELLPLDKDIIKPCFNSSTQKKMKN